MLEKEYKIDRKAAARLLKMSTRSVDRYVKSGRVSSRLIDGRIWLNREELMLFKERKSLPVKKSSLSIDDSVDKVDSGIDNMDNLDNVEILEKNYKTRERKKYGEEGVYKKLYTEVKNELQEKQERLELANYRVGQLEAQVKNSIPLLEYHKQNSDKKILEAKVGKLEKITEEEQGLIKNLMSQLKYEKFSKKIFLILLLMALALQPLWLLLIYR